MYQRKRFRLHLRSRTLTLGERTLVMGVLNVTPDSFSDGGAYLDSGAATARALQTARDGADTPDIGGEPRRLTGFPGGGAAAHPACDRSFARQAAHPDLGGHAQRWRGRGSARRRSGN